MADEVKATVPEAKASATTEGKVSLATIATSVAAVIAGVYVALEQLQSNFPDKAWIGMALSVVGLISAVATSLSMNKNRTMLKGAMIQQHGTASPAAPISSTTAPKSFP